MKTRYLNKTDIGKNKSLFYENQKTADNEQFIFKTSLETKKMTRCIVKRNIKEKLSLVFKQNVLILWCMNKNNKQSNSKQVSFHFPTVMVSNVTYTGLEARTVGRRNGIC